MFLAPNYAISWLEQHSWSKDSCPERADMERRKITNRLGSIMESQGSARFNTQTSHTTWKHCPAWMVFIWLSGVRAFGCMGFGIVACGSDCSYRNFGRSRSVASPVSCDSISMGADLFGGRWPVQSTHSSFVIIPGLGVSGS